MRILGIDPGTIALGYGVIDDSPGIIGTTMVDYGVIFTPVRSPIWERLRFLYRRLEEVVEHYRPDVVAIEQPFVAKNARSAIAIGQAQAVAILATSNQGITVYEYTPTQVKQRVADHGTSSKEQIQEMVKLHLGLHTIPQPSDAADALAVALCHLSETHLTNRLAKQKEG
ncbi:MAG: crossover junction endodeoxyribonuclease RuvC [Dehalococcoidales bacterium]|jgi:crossover junction endodeoxyribonuclease RuvC|nr:crossover junction endodeoxyribonuclease RuvC [Dehalococcoidales bacterium]MDP7109616.1 crossover junction endodeoxyribonuclease RuvC [Dehalococcoidales bacterium]MDP7309519.1 crossover junction endodeoxyribonuclease RuvC [Dehalococcoidales bacterium]MDP7409548.1 crossover junction endodeoxyribonuclease RuvC [Dehalococcoidales bacterium]MDP7675882.1 crossover junction endodeoxyribonuclease RuvC [Dehalococcoidales bacterium]|tara:strand:- start:444 stop:953 length:510 start_codon:yes stop_codon:yes gene_type:complete